MSRMINDKIKILKRGLSVPDTVTEKAEEAFRRIQAESAGHETAGIEPETAGYEAGWKKTARSIYGKKKAWAAIIAILIMSTATVSAATYIRWSQSLERGFRINETQKATLEYIHAVNNPNLSVTDYGVTITAQQCIVDKYSAIITFKISGYELPDDNYPMFAATDIRFNGDGYFNGDRSFYSRVVENQGTEYRMYDDGTPIGPEEEVSDKDRFVMDDGSLEYHIRYFGDARGKQFHAELTGLGNVDRKGRKNFDAPGTWTFDWTLEGTDASKEFALNAPLGDTGIVVSTVEFSPISMCVAYNMPDDIVEKYYVDNKFTNYVNAVVTFTPELTAMHTRSGELIFTPFGSGGMCDFGGSRKEIFYCMTPAERIIEAGEIDALWFYKDGYYWKNRSEPYDEEEFYIVPVN